MSVGNDDDAMEDDETESLDIASGLAVVEALLENLGAFISPYLECLLKIVFIPQVQCPAKQNQKLDA